MKSETSVVKINIEASIDKKLNNLSSNLYAACIYKVVQKLRKANEAAYSPRLVSIGPLHHGLPQLQGMEAFKLRFLNNFLCRFGIGLNTLVEFAARKESFVRGCYEGTVNLSKEQLTEMILLDGIFIVELFLENQFLQLRDRNEIVFRNHWMHIDLLHDLLLLENQLPISIMKKLLAFVDFSFLNEGINLTIYDLAHNFFKDVGNTQKIPLYKYKARHFVEFLLILHAPVHRREPTSAGTKSDHTRSATELHQAGVKFNKTGGNCFFDVDFSEGGVLSIPELIVNDTTETFFRNLIAFEQCGYCGYYSEEITSYVILMDSFIDTRHDVDLLVKSGIIMNKLGDAQKVADLFNNLHKEVVTEANIFYFDELCGKLNDYSKDQLHEWKASCFRWRVMLRRDYFSNPWSFISVLAATVLLILTVIQTICSILQVI